MRRPAEQPQSAPPPGRALPCVGDVLAFEYGKGLRKDKRDGGEYPVYGSNGVVGHHSEALTDDPCLVVGRKGSVGAVHLSRHPCWAIDTAYVAEPPHGIEHAQRNIRITNQCPVNKVKDAERR